eukprot:5112790-Prymnesium_polylepis.1
MRHGLVVGCEARGLGSLGGVLGPLRPFWLQPHLHAPVMRQQSWTHPAGGTDRMAFLRPLANSK